MNNIIPFKSQDDLDTETLYRDWFEFLMLELCTPLELCDKVAPIDLPGWPNPPPVAA